VENKIYLLPNAFDTRIILSAIVHAGIIALAKILLKRVWVPEDAVEVTF